MELGSRRGQAPREKERGLFLRTSKERDRIWLAGFLALPPYRMQWARILGGRGSGMRKTGSSHGFGVLTMGC